MDIGLLLARLTLGLLITGHGAQKLFGWFGGYGLQGTGAFLESLGFRPGRVFATAAALGEVVGGGLVALGLLGTIGPALMLAVMIVAMGSVHWSNGVFATSNGIELPLLYASGAIALALTGPGGYSLDAWLEIASAWTPAVTLAVLAVGAVGGAANLVLRRSAQTVATA